MFVDVRLANPVSYLKFYLQCNISKYIDNNDDKEDDYKRHGMMIMIMMTTRKSKRGMRRKE